jgi:hypothetical protein
MPGGRKPGQLVVGETAQFVLQHLQKKQTTGVLSTRQIADACKLSVNQTKSCLARLLHTGRVLTIVMHRQSYWRCTPVGAFSDPVVSDE